MTIDATTFMCAGGLPQQIAAELAVQIERNAPDATRLVGAFLPDYAGREFEQQIKARKVDVDRLLELQLSPEFAEAFRKAIEALKGNGP